METKLSDRGAKDTFPSDLCIEIYEDDFGVMGRAVIIYVLELSVEASAQIGLML